MVLRTTTFSAVKLPFVPTSSPSSKQFLAGARPVFSDSATQRSSGEKHQTGLTVTTSAAKSSSTQDHLSKLTSTSATGSFQLQALHRPLRQLLELVAQLSRLLFRLRPRSQFSPLSQLHPLQR